MNSTGFPSPSTIACSFVFNPPLVRPTALSAVFSPSVGTFVNLDTGRVQAQVFHIRICGQCAKYGFQCTIVPPFSKSCIHRLPGAIRLRQFPPLHSAADDPKHPTEHVSIIFPRSPSLPRPFWRQHLFYALQLSFCQFISFHISIFALTRNLCNAIFIFQTRPRVTQDQRISRFRWSRQMRASAISGSRKGMSPSNALETASSAS